LEQPEGRYSDAELKAALEETKIKATVRAEALSIDKMAVLAKALLGVAPGI